jgi:hypothetical protein
MTRDELLLHFRANQVVYVERIGERAIYKNERKEKACGIDERPNPDNAYVIWVCKILMIPTPDGIEEHVVKDIHDFENGAESQFGS